MIPAELHIALACDARYLPRVATALRSCLLRDHGRPVRAHVLHGGDVQADDRDAVRAMVEQAGAGLHVHAVEPALVASLPAHPRYGGRALWLRLVLPQLLPDTDRVLYLDADTFVATSLADLWETDLGTSPLAAVSNVVEPAMRGRLADLGIADHRRYFNSGVLVLALDVWRREAITAQVVDAVARAGERFLWPDQDALNVVLGERRVALHPRWNAQSSFWTWRRWAEEVFGAVAVDEAVRDPAIVHFEGPSICKPWHHLNRHPWRDAYRQVQGGTPWARTPVEDRTVATRAIALLPGRYRLEAFARLERLRDSRRGQGDGR